MSRALAGPAAFDFLAELLIAHTLVSTWLVCSKVYKTGFAK